MRGDYVIVAGEYMDEFSQLDDVKSLADYLHGYVIDMATQEIIYDFRQRKVDSELEHCLSCLDQSLSIYMDELGKYEKDLEIVQIRHQIRKLSVLVNKFVNK